MNDLEQLKFPIGKHQEPGQFDEKNLMSWKASLDKLPATLAELTKDLTAEQLNSTYRPRGWNIKQVVHHLADSHMNSFIRFKLALTEENPTVKPYEESKWAEMEDASDMPIELSIAILQGVHGRWTQMLDKMTTDDYKRTFYHPESKQSMSLFWSTSKYAWHSDHHAEHIKNAVLHAHSN